MLPLNLSDTAATSPDGSSLECIAAIASIFRMKVAEGCAMQSMLDACSAAKVGLQFSTAPNPAKSKS